MNQYPNDYHQIRLRSCLKASLVVFILFVSISSGLAQSQKRPGSEDDFVGKWKLDYAASKAKMDNQKKSVLETMSSDQKERIESNYKGRVYQFMLDGKFRLSLISGGGTSGTWRLEKQGKQLIMAFESGDEVVYNIELISESKLSIKAVGKGSSTMLFPYLVLLKQ
ncbi:hypothetical protein [Roseivirga sp. UBA838]|uniref:hypothetical protein n=1 Tax=Roseivirga sp. UBA838 TaxID=1947393 RepID=UPI002580A271|nr:hypothetical protein [Roseivirga sp. UBA838]|tara:strand:- start:4643 stop:5140 length:498 start_codon:yes stop_codon:yes gene_type:complete